MMRTKAYGILLASLLLFAVFASVVAAAPMGVAVGKAMGPRMENTAMKFAGGAFKPDYCGRLSFKMSLFGCGGTPEPRFVRVCAAYAAHMSRTGCVTASPPVAPTTATQ